MKSKINSLASYFDLVSEPVTEQVYIGEITENADRDMQNILLEKKYTADVDTVSAGNIATVDLKSENPRFNRNGLILSVGLNLFSKELETALIGKKVGEEFTFDADGKEVACKVVSCKGQIIPEMTDDFVKSLGLGLETVEQYRQSLIDKYTELYNDAYLEYLAMGVFSEWVEKSDIYLDEAELKGYAEKWAAYQKSVDEFHGVVSGMPEGDMEEMYAEDARLFVSAYLVYCFLSGIDSGDKELDVTNDTFLKEAVKKACEPITNCLKPIFTLELTDSEPEYDE